MSVSSAPARDTSETLCQRETIRSHMKMVIGQLEGILQELKEVAKELREVVGQIDKLTSDFDLDLDPDDWTVATASSTSSGDTFRLDFLNPDVLSDSWEFCSFLESPTPGAAAFTGKPGSDRPGDIEPEQDRVTTTTTAYSQMNGGIPVSNGPLRVTPDSSSEEASSSTHSHKTSRTSGTRERVRFSDKILYHALCCDDDEEDEEEGEESPATPETDASSPTPTSTPSSSEHSLHNCLGPTPVHFAPVERAGVLRAAGMGTATPARKGLPHPSCRRKLLRNSSTQTVSDKSTQTVLPYIPAKHKTKDQN